MIKTAGGQCIFISVFCMCKLSPRHLFSSHSDSEEDMMVDDWLTAKQVSMCVLHPEHTADIF